MSTRSELDRPLTFLFPLSLCPSARKTTSDALHIALRDVGFFYLDVSSYLSEEERTEVLSMGRAFFSESKEDKELVAIDGPSGDGARGERSKLLHILLRTLIASLQARR